MNVGSALLSCHIVLVTFILGSRHGSVSFYGWSSGPHLRYLKSVRDIVESCNNNDLEIVLLHPDTGHKSIDSDDNETITYLMMTEFLKKQRQR